MSAVRHTQELREWQCLQRVLWCPRDIPATGMTSHQHGGPKRFLRIWKGISGALASKSED